MKPFQKLFSSRYLPLLLAVVLIAIAGFVYFTLSSHQEAKATWYNSSWTYRKPITVNATSTAGLTNFPMLFSITDANLADTGYGGGMASSTAGDMVFVDWEGKKINHEIEKYVNTTGELVAWVQVPFVSSTSTRQLYVYYGNAAATYQPTNGAVWDVAYKAVWHLPDGSNLTANDSTSNGNYAYSVHGTAAGSGVIGGDASFNGTTNYVELSWYPSLNIGGPGSYLTIEFWMKAGTATGLLEDLVVKRQAFTDSAAYEVYLNSGDRKLSFNNGTSAVSSTYIPSIGSWVHVALVSTYGGNTDLYINGFYHSTLAVAVGELNSFQQMYLGTFLNYTNAPYHGELDEVRISSDVHSSDWVATSYNNQMSPSSMYSLTGQESQTVAGSSAVKVKGGTKVRGGVKFRFDDVWLQRLL